MLLAGSDDGVYRVTGIDETTPADAEKVLDTGRVTRVRRFDAVDGAFAAAEDGLYHTLDGTDWRDLGVPDGTPYSVAAGPAGDHLYAGTRPSRVFATTSFSAADSPDAGPCEWAELEGFQKLPSRDEWHTPRHQDLSQVRSLGAHPDAPDRVIAGVEVGGVHVSDDRGETWTERKEGVNDDVHHLYVHTAEEYVAATGFGLYRTTDAGRSWTRLDEGVDRRYFRESFVHDGVVYAGAATGSSSTWEDADADHLLLASRDGRTVERVEYPRPDELVIGWAAVDGDLVASTHRGTLLRKRGGEWRVAGDVPTPGSVGGRYLQLARFEP